MRFLGELQYSNPRRQSGAWPRPKSNKNLLHFCIGRGEDHKEKNVAKGSKVPLKSCFYIALHKFSVLYKYL